MKTAIVPAVLSLGILTFGVTLIVHQLLRRRRRATPPPDDPKWHRIGAIELITLFPVKSCAAVELEEAHCDELGLEHMGFRDRGLLVYSEANDKVAYASVYPRMLSIKSELLADGIVCLTAPNEAAILIGIGELIGEHAITERRKKGYRLQWVECKREHHAWCSRVILQSDEGMRLYIVLEPIVETRLWQWRGLNSGYMPLMVMHRKSVQDLNGRLAAQNQVHPQQLRSNLMIHTEPHVTAFDEDDWLWLRIGEAASLEATILRYNSACLRCVLPNINVETCVRNPAFEPLKTLQKYRLRSHPKEPEMGLYFDVLKVGKVKIGDPVYVQYKKHHKQINQ